jgi:hypothetical protein
MRKGLFIVKEIFIMLKKTLTYTDFNDVERTEDFYFNLTEAEVADMELTTEGGMATYLQRIIDSKDQAKLIEAFKEIVLKSYGVKSDDGKRFIKSKEITEAFKQTQAYSDIYMALVFDDVEAAEFVNGILPDAEKLKNKIEAMTNKKK